MFLYILKLPKYNCIKIGVAKSHARIKQHINTYGEIDLNESYIVHATSGDTIRQLEKQLLEDYIDYKIKDVKLMNKDGYTELRSMSVLLDIIQDIDCKANKFKNKGIVITRGIQIEEKKVLKSVIDKPRVKNGVLKLNTGNEDLKNLFTKDEYLFEGVNYLVPETLVIYPMFRWDSGSKSEFEYRINNTSIICSNNNSHRISNHFDFGVLLAIIQIYLESRNITKTSQINENKNNVKISFYKICTTLEIPSTGYYVQRVKDSIDTLSDTEVTIRQKDCDIKKLVLIDKLYLNGKDVDKSLNISTDLLLELKLNNVVMVNKSIFNSSPSPYAKRIQCLINYFLKKKGNLEMSVSDFESIIGSDIPQYTSTRKITNALNYLVENSIIDRYEIIRGKIVIHKYKISK